MSTKTATMGKLPANAGSHIEPQIISPCCIDDSPPPLSQRLIPYRPVPRLTGIQSRFDSDFIQFRMPMLGRFGKGKMARILPAHVHWQMTTGSCPPVHRFAGESFGFQAGLLQSQCVVPGRLQQICCPRFVTPRFVEVYLLRQMYGKDAVPGEMGHAHNRQKRLPPKATGAQIVSSTVPQTRPIRQTVTPNRHVTPSRQTDPKYRHERKYKAYVHACQ